ncbi:MAG: hypothetical protein OEV81_13965 [Betaproteobacteria bacterium]|nr:hypothetical protein [Betaproteobacteria bacterium]MDH5220120.1 hypothetical protein [Betaproteobacteria bacterium]MDH5350866.1 hypothetical protein [Betaproteobacteria bacterium]
MGAIEMSALGMAMRQSLWLYPIVEIVHLTGIALLFGSIAMLDLRLLGLSSSVPVRRLASHVLPWTAASFVLIVPSGLAMFVAHAGDFITSPVFVLKICLILAAGANAAVFHAGAFRGASDWDVNRAPPFAARLAAALSLALWVAVIACGRLLAYT